MIDLRRLRSEKLALFNIFACAFCQGIHFDYYRLWVLHRLALSQIKFHLLWLFLTNFGWSNEPLSWRCGTASFICRRMIPCVIAFLIACERSNVCLFLWINPWIRRDLVCTNSCYPWAFGQLCWGTWVELRDFIALDRILKTNMFENGKTKVTYLLLILFLMLYFNVNFGKEAKAFRQRLIRLRELLLHLVLVFSRLVGLVAVSLQNASVQFLLVSLFFIICIKILKIVLIEILRISYDFLLVFWSCVITVNRLCILILFYIIVGLIIIILLWI